MLLTLSGCPKALPASFYCDNNLLTSFEDFPDYVGGKIYPINNKFPTMSEYFEGIWNFVMNDNYPNYKLGGGIIGLYFMIDHESRGELDSWIMKRKRMDTLKDIIG